MPTNGVIELAFDRLLNPATISRQAMPIRTADGQAAASPVITYDPVTRVVRIQAPSDAPNGEWLDDNQFYTLTLGIPSGDDLNSGLRAIDNATLDPSQPVASRQVSFVACSADKTKTKCQGPLDFVQPSPPPALSFCDDVQPIFVNHCAGALCHAAPGPGHQPAMGLVLDIGEGIRFTAVGRAAEESTTGATSSPQAAGKHFGVNMPIVDPQKPGTSYLLYKLLLAKPSAADAGIDRGRPFCFGDGGTTPVAPTPATLTSVQPPPQDLSDSERAILSNLVPGREMPYPSNPAVPISSDNPPLTMDELERIRLWIDQGAPVESCVPCAVLDGGTD